MASAARIGYNTILKKGDGGSPEAFTDYGWEITSLDGIGFSREAIDATHLQSASGYREFVAGLKTMSPISVEIQWVASNTGALQTLIEATSPLGNWQALFPDNSTVTFSALITSFKLGAVTPDGKLTATVELTPSGAPTWA